MKKTISQRLKDCEEEIEKLKKEVYLAKALATGGIKSDTIYTYKTI